jgi:hypothetical protein
MRLEGGDARVVNDVTLMASPEWEAAKEQALDAVAEEAGVDYLSDEVKAAVELAMKKAVRLSRGERV